MLQNHVHTQNRLGLTYTIENHEDYLNLLTHEAFACACQQGDATAGLIATVTEFYLDTADLYLFRTGYTLVAYVQDETLQLTLTNELFRLRGKINGKARRQSTVSATVPTWKVALHPHRWPKELAAARKLFPTKTKLQLLARLQRTTHRRQLAVVRGDHDEKRYRLCVNQIAILPVPPDPEQWRAMASPILGTLYELTVLPLIDERRIKTAEEKGIRNTIHTTIPVVRQVESTLSRALRCMSTHPTFFQQIPVVEQACVNTTCEDPLSTLNFIAGIQPAMPVTAACRLIWQQQLLEMLCNEAGVRYSNDIEYVHEMRVAIRRARVAFKLYGDYFPRKVLRPYRKRLQRTGQRLGAVRDLDVMLAGAKRPAPAKTRKGKRVPAALVAQWEAQRAAAHDELVAWLDSDEYRAFVVAFWLFCHTRQAPSKAKLQLNKPPLIEVRHVVPALLVARFANVRRYETLFIAREPVPYATIHELRIDCKYLRYSLEFVRHLLGTEGETLIQRLKQLQDLLGDLNDTVVAMARLQEEAGKDAPKGDKAAETAAIYLEQQQAQLDKLIADLPAVFAQFVAQESREMFALALARL